MQCKVICNAVFALFILTFAPVFAKNHWLDEVRSYFLPDKIKSLLLEDNIPGGKYTRGKPPWNSWNCGIQTCREIPWESSGILKGYHVISIKSGNLVYVPTNFLRWFTPHK